MVAVATGAGTQIDAEFEVVSTVFSRQLVEYEKDGAKLCALIQVSMWNTWPGPRPTDGDDAVAVAVVSVNATDIDAVPSPKPPSEGIRLTWLATDADGSRLALAVSAPVAAREVTSPTASKAWRSIRTAFGTTNPQRSSTRRGALPKALCGRPK